MLGIVLTMLWQAWQQDYNIPAPIQSESSTFNSIENTNQSKDVPIIASDNKEYGEFISPDVIALESNKKIIKVNTNLFEIEINALGGTIQKLSLLKYPLNKENKEEKVVLLKNNPEEFYLVQSGILGGEVSANHNKASFGFERQVYSLGGNDSLSVPLVWESETGIKLIKTYTFYRDKYVVDVSHKVVNNSSEDWSGRSYVQINRNKFSDKKSFFIYTYTGAVISSPDNRYEKISFDDIEEEKLSKDIVNGWVAMIQHYFVTALIPGSKEDKYHYYTLNPNNSYVIGAASPVLNISKGENKTFVQHAYLGPKLQKEMPKVADNLELTVDYGIFWFIAEPLYWVLDKIHTITKNWGWSIILVTLLLKLLFYRLSASGYRSMANMRRLQPRLLSIKEKHKGDRTRLNQAMMNIYKEEKINPLGGCFPILIQIPVFISLYWVLLETVELRQADFILWINDLSSPDAYFVLPLLMGVTMFIQQKLNPAPVDPIQAKIMSFLPVIFTVFFAFFPAGLVLYWVANNILSIAQQWMITKNIEKMVKK